MRRGLFHPDDESAVLPEALPLLADLRERGLAHQYVRHIRSSQAFALNLFGPLSDDGTRRVFAHLGHQVDDVEKPQFEYEDPLDRLQEASQRSRHQTQVDVVLRGMTSEGFKVAALIEVKFTEQNFGGCSAFDSADNPVRDVCAHPGLFGGQADRCFQLANHGHGHRKYAEYLSGVPITAPRPDQDDGGCFVRQGRSQPMRNLALAHLLVADGEHDAVVFAVCAPERQPTIWRRFEEFTSVFADTDRVRIRRLPAELVARQQPDHGTAFMARYGDTMRRTGLIHLDIDGSTLLGVWLLDHGLPAGFYPDDGPAETSPDRMYGEAVVLEAVLGGEDWDHLVERLDASSPHVAWWSAVECVADESPEDLFRRVAQDSVE